MLLNQKEIMSNFEQYNPYVSWRQLKYSQGWWDSKEATVNVSCQNHKE